MSQRKPLTTLQNGCFARRKVQQTYGKKGKASAALSGTQDFFRMTNEIEQKLATVKIFDRNDHDEKENQDQESTEHVRDDAKRSSVKHKKTIKAESRPRPKGKEKTLPEDSDTPPLEPKTSDTSDKAPSDRQILRKFAKEHNIGTVASFEVCGDAIDNTYDVEKIGEGTFSSVFALSYKDITHLPHKKKLSDSRTIIVKLMPISLPSQGKVEDQTELSALTSELQTLDAMTKVAGFLDYRTFVLKKGNWPTNFHQAFHRFKTQYPKRAENDDPEEIFEPTQHYAMVEMGYAGIELCVAVKRPSEFQINDIFWSACIHLANAELAVQFEHRDMHVSNICVRSTVPSLERIDIEEATVANMSEKPDIILGMSNIALTIIDYTYSRLTLPPTHSDPERGSNFRDLSSIDNADCELAVENFEKLEADRGDKYEAGIQHLTYAKIAKCIDVNFQRVNEEAQKNDHYMGVSSKPWEQFVPQTNVHWLAYLLKVLRSRAGRIEKTKYVTGSNSLAKELQKEIREKLSAVAECIFNHDIEKVPKSAVDVLRIGVENGWVRQAEIDALKKSWGGT